LPTPPTSLGPLLQSSLGYLTDRKAWGMAGGTNHDLPLALKALRDELNEPRLDWLAYGGWRTSLRLANHLAGVRRQPTLILCQYSLAAAAMGLLADATGIPYFRLILGLITPQELETARPAADELVGLPLQLVRTDVIVAWRGTRYSLFTTIVLDHPLDHQLECELARSPAMNGVTLYSPLCTTRL